MDHDFERERWRGSVTERLDQTEERVKSLFRLTDILSLTLQALALSINTIAVKMSIYAALGGFIGGGIMAAIVSYVFRKQ